MSEASKKEASQEQGKTKQFKKMEEIEGYVLWEHKLGNKHAVMYIEKNLHPLEAAEASSVFAEHFRSMYHQQIKQLTEKPKEEAPNKEVKEEALPEAEKE